MAGAQLRGGEIVSRSIHKTVKGVFGGKSKTQIDAMIDENDPDVVELRRKTALKEAEREAREREASAPAVDGGEEAK